MVTRCPAAALKVPAMTARTLTRRDLLRAGAAGAALIAVPARPAFARSRPVLTHGVQSGDVAAGSGYVWARADRASRMMVEVSRTPRFAHADVIDGPALTAASDYTGKVRLEDLPPGVETFYRVSLEDPSDPGLRSEPLTGSVPHRARWTARRLVRVEWGPRRPGLGHQPGARRLSHLRRDGRA
jgi:alkaline phosphatase D